MLYVLCSKIEIGGMKFEGVHDVAIERSIYKLGATATIKVPVTAVLKYEGQPATEVETAKAIKTGDPVTIELGYDNVYNLEFKGYVKQLNLRTPLEIICEDEFYQTRLKSVTLQGKATLSDVLSSCGLSVGYSATLTLSQFQVDNKPVSWVLGKLKTDYGLSIFFDLEGKVYASEPFKVVGDSIKYKLRENVIFDDDLKYQRADDVKLKITAVCIYRDGTKVEAEIGASDGTEKKLYFYDVQDQNELAALAEAELKRYSYDGYAGKIKTFLLPYAAPAMTAEIYDEVYNERDGRYYIEGVTVSYGRSGARRSVEIGLKV
jgi:hypothetical protein